LKKKVILEKKKKKGKSWKKYKKEEGEMHCGLLIHSKLFVGEE